jgi:hypothetical protein
VLPSKKRQRQARLRARLAALRRAQLLQCQLPLPQQRLLPLPQQRLLRQGRPLE